MSRIDFANSTDLSDFRLLRMAADGMRGWSVGDVVLRVRYSRTSDYSGTCFYREHRIFVNLGRRIRYPYRMDTNLAKTVTEGNRWFRPVFSIGLRDAYEVVLFVFMHELYHLLIYRAKRNVRQKEAMCDRFAARWLVDCFGAKVRDARGRPVARREWDFQDLNRFVAAARDVRTRRPSAACRGARGVPMDGNQRLLFSD